MATLGASGHVAPLDWHMSSLLRQHPLVGYFAQAWGLSWLVLLVLGAWLNLSAAIVIFFYTLGPTSAAVIMTALVHGRAGLRDLLRRVVLGRVGLRWYLVAMVGIPLAMLLATLLLPGALATFSPISPVRLLIAYVVYYVLTGTAGGALFEEPGWRGFALPRMQTQLGPLGGTLLLGVLWGIWHLPQYFVLPAWAAESGGVTAVSVGSELLAVVALAPIMTWLFNHTRGSILLAILAHASVNSAQVALVSPLFPSAANEVVGAMLAFAVVALVLIVVTRGRLGYRWDEVGMPLRSGALGTPSV